MALSRNIRFLRKKQGWGQDVLADKLGYKSYTTIQKWESGVSEPPLKKVHQLAELFSVDIDDLTSRDLEFDSTDLLGPEVSVPADERDILDDVDFAFFGDYKKLNESNKETLRAMARILKEQEEKG